MQSSLKKIPSNTYQLTIEVMPVFSPQEKRDVVTIEDESTHAVYYVDFRDIKHAKEQPQQQDSKMRMEDQQAQKLPKVQDKKATGNVFQTQKKAPPPTAKPTSPYDCYKSLAFVCNSCGYKFPGRIRYASTAIEDYDLCEECFMEVRHPYPMIEVIDGQPTRKIEPPRYPAYGYQRPSTMASYGRYTPRYDMDYFNQPYFSPRYFGTPKRSGFNDFFSMF